MAATHAPKPGANEHLQRPRRSWRTLRILAAEVWFVRLLLALLLGVMAWLMPALGDQFSQPGDASLVVIDFEANGQDSDWPDRNGAADQDDSDEAESDEDASPIRVAANARLGSGTSKRLEQTPSLSQWLVEPLAPPPRTAAAPTDRFA